MHSRQSSSGDLSPNELAKATPEELAALAVLELESIGIREILDQDSRPTFVIDLDPDIDGATNTKVLAPLFGNSSLKIYERLWDVVCGYTTHESPSTPLLYEDFRSWATSRTSFEDTGDVYPSTKVFFGMLWTGSTIRKRFRLISGNHCFTLPDCTGDLSSGPPAEIAAGSYSQQSLDLPDKRRRVQRPSALSRHHTVLTQSEIAGNPESAGVESTLISSAKPKTEKSSDPLESMYSSKSTASINLDTVSHAACDWTAVTPKGFLTEHTKFARAVDWAATSLGAMSTWSSGFRQVCNLVMRSPQPVALFWGTDLTMLYNQAYRDNVAGRKHPALMGATFRTVFGETWEYLAPLFQDCADTGNPVAMQDQMLPIERHGFVEETYFTWSFTPLYGDGQKILGFYNAPFETTSFVLSKRRTMTLRRLGEEIALIRTMSDFWQSVLRGLEENKYDLPVAILYSVVDAEVDEESSSNSGSAISLKSLQLEGSLGIPDGHAGIPAKLDLKRSTEGFVPSFREAMRTREPTKLTIRDGTLPESLLEGIEWRGYEEPCREAVIFPVRPTNGDAVMAFLLIGINPRRPYDESYQSFVHMLNRQLATSLASTILFEEEIRRGQTAAEAAAKEKEHLSEQLAAQTLRMQKMAETSTVGMYYIDASGALIEANDRFFEMSGCPRDAVSSKSKMFFKDLIHEDSMAVAMKSWHIYTVEGRHWSGEIRYKKPWVDPITGEVLENWAMAASTPELDAHGSFTSLLGSITDISRIKWAEGLQNRRLRDAEETRRQTNNFLDLTSHEMRNPLSAMIHCADEIQILLKEADAPAAVNGGLTSQSILDCIEAAETIALCAQHQKSIVDDILTVSKLDSDLLVITPMVVQPVSVAKQALKMFDAEVHKKNIKCEYLVEDSVRALGVDWVFLDRSRVLQVLINLLTNAIKFTQDKAKRVITVRLGASIDPPHPDAFDFEYIHRKTPDAKTFDSEEWGTGESLYLQFQVQDTGRGLTREEKKKLFGRFAQATPRTHAQYGGSGLGLFISRQLTELHGGQIGVGSEAGVGSTFAFFVRCRKSTAQQARLEHDQQMTPKTVEALKDTLPMRTGRESLGATPPPQSRAAFDWKELHVLIVEDNLVNQRVLSKQLIKLGCTVAVADHGGFALAHIEKTKYWHERQIDGDPLTIILMDMEMPVMDGLSCVKRIRELEHNGSIVSHIPVIAVTANVRSELVATAKESGMDDVVSKPFRIPELLAKISEILCA